jgi:hypothetical protein
MNNQDNNRNVDRKKIVLFEKTKQIRQKLFQHPKQLDLSIFYHIEFLNKNNFSIEMFMDTKLIKTHHIKGFSVQFNTEKSIRVYTAIHANGCFDDYYKVNIIKAFLYDNLGNEIQGFDWDVNFKGYSFECDYDKTGIFVPTFSYGILD